MRVQSRIPFGCRKSGVTEERRKYFFAFEGSNSEPNYFNGLFRVLQQSSENPVLFEVILFSRTKANRGNSNPKKIYDNLRKYLEIRCFTTVLCYSDIIESFFLMYQPGLLCGKAKVLAFKEYQSILSKLRLNATDIVEDSKVLLLITDLQAFCQEKLSIKGGVENIQEVMNLLRRDDILYDEMRDSICLVVDRDKNSFSNTQFDAVYKGCVDNGYRLFVTNPCFEFFLLLHKSDCTSLPLDDLICNKKSNGRTYVERELRKHVKGYRKGDFAFSVFQDDIRTAIVNARYFTSDLSLIKNQIGTNLPEIITEILSMMSIPSGE